MSKTTDLELRLAIIERRQQLLFDSLKSGNVTLAHHWKRASDWCEKRANEALPPVRPRPEPGPRVPTTTPDDPAAYVEPEPEPASPWRDEEGNVIQIEGHPVTGSPVRSVEGESE